jgi:hypothetical protein
MVWSAFRASDDQQKYSYHIPDNMYLVGALQRLRVMNAATWRNPYISNTAAKLVEEVSRGIEQHGIVKLQVRVPGTPVRRGKAWHMMHWAELNLAGLPQAGGHLCMDTSWVGVCCMGVGVLL